ncbi:MAG: 3'-5' exonuclease [Flavobacteriales bacterium]|jgi:DNA polymerase-3 subunit epsilon|nr:3'-5' exonuclease [Flavobacteriales bacterium]
MRIQLERPLAFFDLETTGTRIGRDRIVQIGIVRLMPDGSRDQYQVLVNPGMPIPAEATAVHGITDLDVAMAPALEAVAQEVMDQLAGCDLAGFNVLRFDLPFLTEELHRVGRDWNTAAVRVVDVQRIYHQKERRDLSAALQFYCGRAHEGAHDALADVEATADVLLAQLERYPDLPADVPALGGFSGDMDRRPDPAGKLRFDERGQVCLAFGKYAGWTLENIGRNDPGYIQWLMTKAELPGSTLAVMKEALADMHA